MGQIPLSSQLNPDNGNQEEMKTMQDGHTQTYGKQKLSVKVLHLNSLLA